MLGTLRFIWGHPLNRNGRLSGLLRFLRWQLGSRLMPYPQHLPFVNDTILVTERGMTGATGNWYCGLHESADMIFVLKLLRAEDVFVDVGANVGSYTVLAAGAVGATTYAFEPAPETFPKLIRNVAVNGIGERVKAFPCALGAEAARMRFTTGRDTTNRMAQSEEDSRGSAEIDVRRLDDVLGEAVPLLVKIDVEGWESEVLAGMPRILGSPGLAAILMETNDSDRHYSERGAPRAADVLLAAGFHPFHYDPVGNRLLPGGTPHNTVYVRDAERIERRLADAPGYRLVNGTI